MTHLLAAAFAVLYVTQLAVAPIVKGNVDATRVWLRMGQVSGSVAILLSILTLV